MRSVREEYRTCLFLALDRVKSLGTSHQLSRLLKAIWLKVLTAERASSVGFS